MKWFFLVLLNLAVSASLASTEGANIYLMGKDLDNQAITVTINDLDSSAALACVNCHRESGLGTSESGTTFPPVSWKILSEDQPADKHSRFYSLQNKRPAYDSQLLYRLLTTGVNSKGSRVDPLMPRYQLTLQQTENLIEYLKKLYVADDPGVDSENINIATIVDSRLPARERQQHLSFIRGLFDMKNARTRGELKRKKFSPVQKKPQYESYRNWHLSVWELPEDIDLWQQTLENYYDNGPAFVVLAPLVRDSYANIQTFCTAREIPCLLANGNGSIGSNGDYYNFVYRDTAKQQADYIAAKYRSEKDKLLYMDVDGQLKKVKEGQARLPELGDSSLATLEADFERICGDDSTLVLMADIAVAEKAYGLDCSADQQLKIMLLASPTVTFEEISKISNAHPSSDICWATDYDKILKRNTRKIRVSILARKFGLEDVGGELLAQKLYAFGLLSDSIHQLAGVFSRRYLLEVMEHMLNSYPNYTYYSSVTGAPYQRAIVGSYREYCPAGGQA